MQNQMIENTKETKAFKKYSIKPIHSGLGFEQVTPTTAKKTEASLPLYQKMNLNSEKKPEFSDEEVFKKLKKNSLGPVYWSKRIFAYGVDFIFSMIFGFLGIWLIASFQPTVGLQLILQDLSFLLTYFGLGLVLHWSFICLQETVFGVTLGKSIFGLRLMGTATDRFLRAFLFPLSVFSFGLGLIWGFFSSSGMCWHDSVAGIRPEEGSHLGF